MPINAPAVPHIKFSVTNPIPIPIINPPKIKLTENSSASLSISSNIPFSLLSINSCLELFSSNFSSYSIINSSKLTPNIFLNKIRLSISG